MSTPNLFEAFPSLENQIPWVPLVDSPTPVKRLNKVEEVVQSSHPLWIKQDNLTSTRFGGNKVRKLEFILGDALKQKKTTIATIGGLGTNHGLATSIFGREAGMKVRLYLFDQPITPLVLQNLRLLWYFGAQLVHGKTYPMILRRIKYLDRLRHRNTYWLPAGGSTAIGALGFVNAVFELKHQIDQGELPEPSHIFIPMGTMGTLAGIELGAQLAGLQSTVVGVRVIDSSIAHDQGVINLVQQTQHYLQQRLKLDMPYTPRFQLDHNFFGEHYGVPTPETLHAIQLGATYGALMLDPTYSGKAFASFLHHAKTAPSNQPILFWNTYSSVDLTSIANQVDYHALPSSFHKFFEQ